MDAWTIVIGGVAALVILGLSIGIAALAADETETAPPRAAGLKQDQHVIQRRARARELQQDAERERDELVTYWNLGPPDA